MPKAKKCSCWKGYSRVPGSKPCAPGSCKKDRVMRGFVGRRMPKGR